MIGLAEFIKTHVDDINNNNFTKVYRELHDEVQVGESVSKFTDILLDAGINPLMYMKTIPQYYMSGSSQTSIEIPEHIQSIDFDALANHNMGKGSSWRISVTGQHSGIASLALS